MHLLIQLQLLFLTVNAQLTHYNYAATTQPIAGQVLSSGASIIPSAETEQLVLQAPSNPEPKHFKPPPPAGAEIQRARLDTEYSKEYYSYSAPDEQFDEPSAGENLAAAAKKNLRVLFIRTPEHKQLQQVALALAKQAAEQHTAIYVLTKHTDPTELAGKLMALQQSSIRHKPEVHFVKYRTAEEALRAQQIIQAQYDQLPGQAVASAERKAVVLDFAAQQKRGNNAAISSYLPPQLRSRR